MNENNGTNEGIWVIDRAKPMHIAPPDFILPENHSDWCGKTDSEYKAEHYGRMAKGFFILALIVLFIGGIITICSYLWQ